MTAWAILDGKKIMFVGGCEYPGAETSINHLEIFPTYKDAKEVAHDPDLGIRPEIVSCEITYTIPK